MSLADQTPLGANVAVAEGLLRVTAAYPNDLATDPCVASAIAVATQPGEFPAAVLGMISQQLANGVSREVAAQSHSLHLVLDTSHGHRRPA
jgi:hypothetical protein